MAASSSASALRRRLERDGNYTGNLDESFVVIGTPLPALTSTKHDPNELKPVWEQEVRDEQGRQRFHGAFTGGFSAGYFNTVGSKEGWTPSSFKSSRKAGAGAGIGTGQEDAGSKGKGKGKAGQQHQQRIEDFMDEEDLRELHDARELRGADAYAGPSNTTTTTASNSGAGYDPILGAFGVAPSSSIQSAIGSAADGRIRAAPESLGTELLRKLGWKEGHGIGPRVTRKRRDELRTLLAPRQTSSEITTAADEDDEPIPSTSRKLLYPPPDTPILRPPSSVPGRGLGWTAPLGLHEALGTQDASGKNSGFATAGLAPGSSTKGKQRQQHGFGISVLEHDSDDEGEIGGDAVYAMADDIRMSTLNDRERSRDRTRDADRRSHTTGKPSTGAQDAGDSNKENTWRDGRPMPTGFVRARTKDGGFTVDQIFVAPPLPQGWKPNPGAIWARHAPPSDTALSSKGPEVVGPSGPTMVPQERGELLGELRMPGPPPVLSDYLSAKARERLAATALASDDDATIPLPIDLPLHIPHLDSVVAKAALQGYMPFGNDAAKQERYRIYLRSQTQPGAGTAEHIASALEDELKATVPAPSTPPSRASRWDARASQPPPRPSLDRDQIRRELDEFFRSATIFRPSNAIINNRFTSAKEQVRAGGGAAESGGLYVPSAADRAASVAAAKVLQEDLSSSSSAGTGSGELVVAAENEDPAAKAADAGMFGVLTRRYRPWYPARLLCKRFGVPDPHPDYMGGKYGEDGGGSGLQEQEPGDPFGSGSGLRKRAGGGSGGRGQSDVNALWEQNKRGIEQLARERQWESSAAAATGTGPGLGADGNDLMDDRSGQDGRGTSSSSSSSRRGGPRSLETVGLGEDETQGRDTLEYVKPPMEVFRAVFVSDVDLLEDDEEQDGDDGHDRGDATGKRGSFLDDEEMRARELKRRRIINADVLRPVADGDESASGAVGGGDLASLGAVRFVPRSSHKRKTGGGEEGGEEGPTGGAGDTSSSLAAKLKKKAKKKKAGSGLLTFDLEEGDGDESGFGSPTIKPLAQKRAKVVEDSATTAPDAIAGEGSPREDQDRSGGPAIQTAEIAAPFIKPGAGNGHAPSSRAAEAKPAPARRARAEDYF
ncbi:hypothetical protein V8E36_004957 [Tilletia maclaganii]